MAQTTARKLIFRLGETGFLLDLQLLVEVCDQLEGRFDSGYAVTAQGIVGALSFRQTQVPLVDPKLYFNMSTELSLTEKRALVLKGEEGNWALLVDRVDEILPVEKLIPCAIPLLLKNSVAGCYSRLSLVSGEPMVHFDPEQFNGSVSVL